MTYLDNISTNECKMKRTRLKHSCRHKRKSVKGNFYLDLLNKIQTVYRKWRNFQPRRRRLFDLAVPKYSREKYRRPALSRRQIASPKVEIIRDQRRLSTRAEQLAYSSIRRLIATRDEVRSIVPPAIYERFIRYIHRGMYSMYARLANSIPPVITNPIQRWTKDEWEQHIEKLKKLAMPKKFPDPIPMIRLKKPLYELERRLEFLAQPTNLPEKYTPIPNVKSSALKYVITERTDELSKPKPVRELPPRKPRRFRGKKYEVSERTAELAKHRMKRTAISDAKENPFQVPPNALKAKATERVKILAIAKEYPEIKFKDPVAISPAALKAKTSKRIIELAMPKGKGW